LVTLLNNRFAVSWASSKEIQDTQNMKITTWSLMESKSIYLR